MQAQWAMALRMYLHKCFEVNLIDVSAAQLDKAMQRFQKILTGKLSKDTISEDIKNRHLHNITTFTSLQEGVKNADLVVKLPQKILI